MAAVAAMLLVIGLFSTFYPLSNDRPKDEIVIETGAFVGTHGVLKHHVVPHTEFINARVVKQTYDFSCGSAALATLLNYNFGEKLDETRVIEGLMRHGDAEKIEQRRAFSLLDMKSFIDVIGYKGVGYNAEIEDLKTLKEPGIVPISVFGYKHFVVFKGIHGEHVFLADPSKGNISFTLNHFIDMWPEKVIFIVYPKGKEQTWHPLKLTDEDLRYIDIDTTKRLMLEYNYPNTLPAEHDLIEQRGGALFYRID